MPGPTRTALLSVSDKTGLPKLGKSLAELGYRLVASGGTAAALRESGLEVTTVEEVTGVPAMLGGRVKTLHPSIHAGILARSSIDDAFELKEHGIAPIDLVVVNLYPFAATAAEPGSAPDDVLEAIDIGGVALLRAAAKSFERVTVMVDPADYDDVIQSLWERSLDQTARRALAAKAFWHTTAYDAGIASWLEAEPAPESDPDDEDPSDGATSGSHPLRVSAASFEIARRLPPRVALVGTRSRELRYGENPHQAGAYYRIAGSKIRLHPCGGLKELSFNNLLDVDAAWRLVDGLPADGPARAVVIKHAGPCGAASAGSLGEALRRAVACDRESAFGSVIGCSRPLTRAAVGALDGLFVEAIVAPSIEPAAKEWLAEKKPRCRLVEGKPSPADGRETQVRSLAGGLLVQTADDRTAERARWDVVTEQAPDAAGWRDLQLAWSVVSHVRSNAVVIARDGATVGIGGGQPSRVGAARLAVASAGGRARLAAAASDAFFPFPDGLEVLAEAGVNVIVQPGGSKRDREVIDAADDLGIAMIFTGTRHFRH